MSSVDPGATSRLLVEDVTVHYNGVPVLEHVSFNVGPAALVGVVGPNGAGKSTLFNAVVGLLPLQSGQVLVNGLPPRRARGLVAYVPQRDSVNWRVPVTVEDVVMMGRTRRIGWLRRPRSQDRERVHWALERAGMAGRRGTPIGELSGGQRQRVFVARALAQEAPILLLDEAFSGVDVASQEALVRLLRDLRDEGKTILMATHDLTRLAERFDACLCLNRHVCAYGAPEQAFTPQVLEELYGPHGVIYAGGGR